MVVHSWFEALHGHPGKLLEHEWASALRLHALIITIRQAFAR
jgi:hypothetical protein